MTTVSTLGIPAARLPRSPAEMITPIVADIPVVSGTANSGDDITVFTPPAGARIIGAKLRQTATLGASATAQLRQGSTALTSATSAGSANGVLQTGVLEPCSGSETINILIGGANITASATLRVELLMVMPKG
jgi:hypothetical protein